MSGQYMANAFATMGNDFMSSYQTTLASNEKRKRQEVEDAWIAEQRGRQRAEWKRADDGDAAVSGAMAPAARSEGYRITDNAGSDASTGDPAAAALLQEYAAGNGGAMQQPSYRVQGQGYNTSAEADDAATKYNSPSQQMGRSADAVAAIDPTRSQRLRTDATTQESNEFKLSAERQAHLDETYNNEMFKIIEQAATWHEGAANFATKQLRGQGEASSQLSPDGKTVTMVVTKPNGEQQIAGVYPSGPAGFQQFAEKAAKLPAKSKIAILTANADEEKAAAAAEQTKQDGLSKEKRDFGSQKELLGIAQGYRVQNAATDRRHASGSSGSLVTVAGPDGNPVYARVQGGKLAAVEMGGMTIPRKEVNPVQYAATMKSNFEIYGDPKLAKIVTDEAYGIGPGQQAGADQPLQKLNTQRGAPQGAPSPAPRQAMSPVTSNADRLRSFYVDTKVPQQP